MYPDPEARAVRRELPTAAECNAGMRSAYAACRDDLEAAKRRHSQELARIRQHRDDMLAVWRRRLAAATS